MAILCISSKLALDRGIWYQNIMPFIAFTADRVFVHTANPTLRTPSFKFEISEPKM